MNAWLILLAAGLFEVVWAVGLKSTDGFTRLLPSAVTLAAMAVSIFLLGRAVAVLPVGTAYAVWTGIGAVGVAAIGMTVLDEPVTPLRLASIGAIVLGMVGLKLS